MKHYIALLLLALCCLLTNSALAFTVPSPTGYLNDQVGKISVSDKIKLERKLRAIDESTNNEVAILLVKSLDGDNIEDATNKVFNTWKVGKAGLDNGVLLLIAVNDHKMRIETGKGVEGDLTDLQTQDIQRDMKPFLRKNDFAGACNLAADRISAALESRKGQKADPGKGAQFNQPLPASTSETSSSAPPRPPSCSIGFGAYGFGMATALVLFLLTFYFVLRRMFPASSKPKVQRPLYSYSSGYSGSPADNLVDVVPPTQRSYTPSSVRHTLHTANYEPEEEDEPTLPNVLENLAPAVVAPTLKTVVDNWNASSREEPTSLGKDYDDDTQPSGFGGGSSGGGGSSYNWDDDNTDSAEDSSDSGDSNNDTDSSYDGDADADDDADSW